MPSIAQEIQDPIYNNGGIKKRRWEDASLEMGRQQVKVMTSSPKPIHRDEARFEYILPVAHQAPPARIIKSAKRQRVERMQSSPFSFASTTTTMHTQPEHILGSGKDSYFPTATTHIIFPNPSSHHNHSSIQTMNYSETTSNQDAARWPMSSARQANTSATNVTAKKNLSPCHICHRRPTLMTELDSYADCEGCGERTCWICIRECAGFEGGVGSISMRGGGFEGDGRCGGTEEDWSQGEGGHRGMVCSRCCVERGSEGEVWCLGCLRSDGAVGFG